MPPLWPGPETPYDSTETEWETGDGWPFLHGKPWTAWHFQFKMMAPRLKFELTMEFTVRIAMLGLRHHHTAQQGQARSQCVDHAKGLSQHTSG